jgi:GrpB-like predicted nucleotidyltransferase (UPF0157 family)
VPRTAELDVALHNPSMEKSPDAPIELVASQAGWPALFSAEAATLSAVLSPWLVGQIEHIGSTAVPGLLAKPIIDMMAPVKSLIGSIGAIEAAASAGWVYHPYKAEVMHWFCKPSPAHRTHHLHIVPIDSQLWRDRLAFRDALRSQPETAEAYAQLKLSLAQKYSRDREAYTEAKTSFVAQVIAAWNRGAGAAVHTAGNPDPVSQRSRA